LKKIFLLLSLSFFLFSCTKDDRGSTEKEYDTLQDALNDNASFSGLVANYAPSDFYGLEYGGGLIFYINTNNNFAMVAAPIDVNEENNQFTGAPWRPDTSGVYIGTTFKDIGTGKNNTDSIVTAYQEGYYAAWLCYDYSHAGYDDWFLPSKDELNELYVNLHLEGLGDFNNNAVYWSSSGGSHNAWYQFFKFGDQDRFGSLGYFYVRPIRSFTF